MRIEEIGKIIGGQDGAIFGNELFRMDSRGNCTVFDLAGLREGEITKLSGIAKFTLDRADRICPHSNAVCFGKAYYAEGDEFPLLYTNIYNNYAGAEDKRIGMCCVYRLVRTGATFVTTLVQVIEIGFVTDPTLWRAYPDRDCVRPYGNFLVDKKSGDYYAFVMRSPEDGTRYFKFRTPDPSEGVLDPELGVKRVVLGKEAILDWFDTPHHYFLQGAIIHDGLLYTSEGFDSDEENRPAIRVIDLAARRQILHRDLMEIGYHAEPEMIDFLGDACLYSDAGGRLYRLTL